jgi:ABC-type lipoprotein export system ATPase subunit
MKIVELSGLSKHHGPQKIFDHVSFSFPDKGLIAVVGDSGSGKTSLLDVIAGLDCDYSGSVVVLGHPMRRLSEEKRSSFRLRDIGYIRQNFDLLELENAINNVLLPLNALSNDSDSLNRRKALLLLSEFGLGNMASRRVNTLSGGEKQRVALARAIINDPPILLADEPTGALDEANAEKIYELLARLSKKRLVILVSHDEKRTGRFADLIIRLREGRFEFQSSNRMLENENHTILPKSDFGKSDVKVPLSEWLRHGFHLNKAKKWRTLLSRFILSFSFLALGLSLFVSKDLSCELESAFSSLTGSGLVVAEPSNKGEGTFGKIVAASESDVSSVVNRHSDLVSDYGVSYLADFENFFPDFHVAYVPLKNKKHLIEDMSIRTAADFLWLDQGKLECYPERPSFMEDDEIVLGLPFDAMTSLCLDLGIIRNYEELGKFISVHPLELVFDLVNDEWSYTDEQMLRIRSIAVSDRPHLYHTNHRWSTYLFETKMRFPTSDAPDGSKPWIIQKIYFVQRKLDAYQFRRKIRSAADLADFVFDGLRKEYALSLVDDIHSEAEGRYYVFLADKRSLGFEKLNDIGKNSYFSGCLFGAEGSYMAYPESLMVGFANPFYASTNFDSIEKIIDLKSDQTAAENELEVALPDKTVMGSYLKPASSCLTLSSDFSNLVSGRRPDNLTEVVLSKRLDDFLGHPKSIFVAGQTGGEEAKEHITRVFKTTKVDVVGICAGESEKFHVVDSWAIDFFSEVLGMSSFVLEPTRGLFFLKSGINGWEVAKTLSREYPDCLFTDPSEKISASVREIVSYVDLALFGGMGSCLLLSLLLLGVVVFLTIEENEREGRMLFDLGIARNDISDAFGASILLNLCASLGTGALLVSLLEFVVDRVIKNSFAYGGPFIFDPLPLLAIVLCGSVSLVLLQVLVNAWIHRRNFRAEGR